MKWQLSHHTQTQKQCKTMIQPLQAKNERLAFIHALALYRCYLDSRSLCVSPTTARAFSLLTRKCCHHDIPDGLFITSVKHKCSSPAQKREEKQKKTKTRWAERLSRFQFTCKYRPGHVNVADPLSRHPAFEATIALSSITLVSCLTLSSAVGAMLSAVVTRNRAAPPPLAARNTSADTPETAPAAAQHACTDTCQTALAPTAVPDHAAVDVAIENVEAATADADMLSQLI